MNNTIVKTILLSAAAVLAVSCGAPKEKTVEPVKEVIPKVKVTTAAVKIVPQTETYSSTVEPFAKNNIAPQSGGRIQRINVEIGDFVTKGQVLAEMDRLQLDQTRLSLINDSTELDRTRALFNEGGVSKSNLEAMELAYSVKKTTYQNLLENTILRAPISGVITARNYDNGDMYAMAQPIYVLQQITPVKIIVGISEIDYSKVKKGDNVDIIVDAIPGRTFAGKVNRIYPTVNQLAHTVNVEVLVGNADRSLRPGMYAKVTVNFESRESVVVPDSAVIKQQGSGQRIAYVLTEEGTVELRVITLGRHIESEYEIVSGIADGEQIVVKGQNSLRDGVKVEVLAN